MMINVPGWSPTPTGDLPIVDRWKAVADKPLPSNLDISAISGPRTCHTWVLKHISYQPELAGKDKWQAPTDTLALGTGDCEDICILERAILKALGWRADSIWMLIVYDLITRQDHALLWLSGRTAVADIYLDSRVVHAIPHSNFQDYLPIIAFSDSQAVTFGRKAKA
jgi:hypothetical protein